MVSVSTNLAIQERLCEEDERNYKEMLKHQGHNVKMETWDASCGGEGAGVVCVTCNMPIVIFEPQP